MLSVLIFAGGLAVSPAGGANRPVTMHDAPGAKVVTCTSCPPPGPHVVKSETIENSFAVPGVVSMALVIPVSGTFPVLVSVKTCTGQVSKVQPRAAVGLHVVGVNVALTIATGGADPNSIAPGSKWAPAPVSPGSGLALPKKSVAG